MSRLELVADIIAALFWVGIIVAMMFSGNTFGDRCARVHERDTPKFKQCVSAYARGSNNLPQQQANKE